MPDDSNSNLSFAQRWVAEESSRLISGQDLKKTALLLTLLPVAAFIPRRFWPSVTRRLARLLNRVFVKRLPGLASSVPGHLTSLTGLPALALAVEVEVAYLLECTEVIAANLNKSRIGSVSLQGHEIIAQALGRGCGVILWVERCNSSSLLTKAAFAQAGFRVHHLSRPSHGFSNTRFGVRFLNSLYRHAEAPFIAERIMVFEAKAVAATRHIRDLLRDNQVVSITVGDTGAQVVQVPALDGRVSVATGAAHLAHSTGATLLPVFSFRRNNEYIVQAGKPILLTEQTRDEALESAAKAYSEQLTAFVDRHPLDWVGWRGGALLEV